MRPTGSQAGQTASQLSAGTSPAAADFDGDGVTNDAETCPTISAAGTGDGCPVQPAPVAEDAKAPSAAMTAPVSANNLPATITASWHGTDTAATGSYASGVASFDVRYRKAAWNTALGAFVLPATWQATTATTKTLTGSLGAKYCFSARARDNRGNVSGWSTERCTARPLDGRSLAASTAGWTRATGTAFYNGTITRTTTKGAILTRTGVLRGRAALVVTRCSTCGSVGVYYNGVLVKTVSLAATTTQRKVVIALPNFTPTSGTVKLKVLSSSKSVQIDGFLIARL